MRDESVQARVQGASRGRGSRRGRVVARDHSSLLFANLREGSFAKKLRFARVAYSRERPFPVRSAAPIAALLGPRSDCIAMPFAMPTDVG